MGKEKYAPLSNIGASTYSTMPRITNDYYATSPLAITLLHKHSLLDKDKPYWQCAVGEGNLSKELKRLGYTFFVMDVENVQSMEDSAGVEDNQ